MSRPVDPAELVERIRRGEARAVARAISLIENARPGSIARSGERRSVLRELAAGLAPYAGRAQVVGITGSPGVGKSTSTTMLVTALRAAHRRVGVLAVDPSSPFSGGALLGDRVRMQEHATDPGVFIRSMASRGHLGGMAAATPQAIRVLDAAGCDVVLVETVGVGQAEVDVASTADTTLVLLAPGMGDGIQAAKAGILEVADVFVVNKADRDGAEQTVRDLRYMLSLGGRHSAAGAWRPPIVTTVASRGQGADDVLGAVERHRDWLASTDELTRRRAARAAGEIEALAAGALRRRTAALRGQSALPALAERVVAGESDPSSAAAELLGPLTGAPGP
ncbi:MAG: methylmalonyl Co-A mutase-associated GTPase MeaB [Mycobacteriales bacterium]